MLADKARLYLETSVLSYMVARPSRDLVVTAHQEITQEWWEQREPRFEVFVSDLVHLEAARGDHEAAGKRLEIIKPFAVLESVAETRALAAVYLKDIPLPTMAGADALHLALAAWHEMDFLLTWNCRHIANGVVRRRLAEINQHRGILSPTICTPEELLYGFENME